MVIRRLEASRWCSKKAGKGPGARHCGAGGFAEIHGLGKVRDWLPGMAAFGSGAGWRSRVTSARDGSGRLGWVPF